MRLLLDTHAFLWWIADDARLSNRARSAIANRKDECFVSLASCWEMAIKVSLDKLTLAAPVDRFVPEQLATNGFGLLPIEFAHVARAARLAFHRRDPFDRLLTAQALVEDLAIVSADPIFRRYGLTRVW
ncbi:MAG: twitching motility protein PilT [Betaproteobacteria bacterium RIFCSPLOWO2_12_FULL_63_13]|nr:MAG: twitching motility protein PilT [Betaproteobacteria bacterium RIFCSPLOWO2_12_FULL_63_13]